MTLDAPAQPDAAIAPPHPDRVAILARAKAVPKDAPAAVRRDALTATDPLVADVPNDAEVRVVRAALDVELGDVDAAANELTRAELATADAGAWRPVVKAILDKRPADERVAKIARELHIVPATPTATAVASDAARSTAPAPAPVPAPAPGIRQQHQYLLHHPRLLQRTSRPRVAPTSTSGKISR